MEAITSAISVQVDTKDKEQANNILKSLGLNMSTFVNMAIKQLIYTDGLPFEVKNPNPNSKLLNALNESEDILSNKINAKKYHNMDELLKDLKDWSIMILNMKYNIRVNLKKILKRFLNKEKIRKNSLMFWIK